MRQFSAIAFSLALAATPVLSDTSDQAGDSAEPEGFSLMEEAAKALLRGFLQELEPALEDLEGLAEEMAEGMAEDLGPALEELRGMIGDFSAWHLPEVLPNGDIIIRRKIPLLPVPAPEIEL